MKKLVIIVLALVVSFFTNAEAQDNREKLFDKIVGSYTEPTGGTAEIRKADEAKKEDGFFRFILSNSDTPGNWNISMNSAGGEPVGFTFVKGPFKGQKYKFVTGADGQVELHEEGGKKTVWTKVKKN